jgi:tetratricopeptide (TPR) repeat protein
MSAVGACVGAALGTGGAADGAGLVPSDFARLQAAMASGIATKAASEASRRLPIKRERISRAKRAEPRGHPTRRRPIMGTLGPELLFVTAIMAAIGALSASRQGRRDIVATWRRGQAAFAADRFDEAEQCFLVTLGIAEQRFGPDHWRTALHVNALAQALVGQKRLDEASPLVDRALGIVERWSPMPHTEAASVILGAATFESARGRHSRAMMLVDRARRATKNEPTMRATLERTVARLEAVAGHDAEAADALARIPFERLEPRDVRALATFGVACLREGDPERAVRCFTSAHALVERESPGEFAEAFYLGLLGEVLARCGRDEEARRALEQAVIDYDAVLGEHHPASAALLVELAEVRLRLGDGAGARVACERVVAMRTISGGPAEDPYRTSAATGDPLGLERNRAQSLLARARRG